ncbi:rifin [Plasmodium falciparum RAJ116]|uniref:Rifin n=1 Tax=Plasmodium falciparum RAJ116 TaxID=580058 RepID=A0A0L0CRP8_PLAFA|nr:rifin [Plasmodium falciparum RAJ116]
MKLQYSKILLFSLPLNILVSSSYAHNKNKACIITHTRTTTSRVLSECDLYIPKYDNDADMKSVKENFDRQTSQRFEEYEERMQEKRKKRKEQRDKNIQKIIHKDKMEKNLAEKVEIGCLRCGCALGGVAASVGVLGTAVVYALKTAALDAAIDAAIAGGEAEGVAAGDIAGAAEVIRLIKKTLGIERLAFGTLDKIIDANTYNNAELISGSIYSQYSVTCKLGPPPPGADTSICNALGVAGLGEEQALGVNLTTLEGIRTSVEVMVSDAEGVAKVFTNSATEKAIATLIPKNMGAVNTTYASCQSAIIASVVAIVVIALVMIIIYLVLRYRRKKKMNKKAQYTELLNQ